MGFEWSGRARQEQSATKSPEKEIAEGNAAEKLTGLVQPAIALTLRSPLPAPTPAPVNAIFFRDGVTAQNPLSGPEAGVGVPECRGSEGGGNFVNTLLTTDCDYPLEKQRKISRFFAEGLSRRRLTEGGSLTPPYIQYALFQ